MRKHARVFLNYVQFTFKTYRMSKYCKAKRENSRTSMLCPSQRKYENNTRREFTRQNEELGVGQFV